MNNSEGSLSTAPRTHLRFITTALLISLAVIGGLLLSMLPVMPAQAAPQNYTCLYYKVRRGNTLSGIGARYGVTVRQIMNANGMRSTRIYTGTTLCIPRYVPVKHQPAHPHPQPPSMQYCPDETGYNCPLNPNPIPYPYGWSWYQPVVVIPLISAPFPCSKGYFNESNLCVLQPYPVSTGTTAYAVWNISDFSYGEFDMGDGRGFVGPILHEQKVQIPNVTGARLIQLRWQDRAGNWHSDSMTLQVAP